jgi:TolB-like protein
MASLLSELKRRNVFKVGVAYLVVGWIVVQVTSTVQPALKLPEFTLPLVIWLGVAGFPFALLFAWAFELTPEGLRRTEDVDAAQSVTSQTGARLNRLVIGLMALAIAFLVVDRIRTRSPAKAPEATSSEARAGAGGSAPVARQSIAVLPFVNMSDDKENEYFGDGLAEELLNLLAKVPDLKVAARTSSFHFKGKNPTIAEVAEALNVDTVLEGSVRRSGDTIRVVAQLISAKDSKHLWSEKYDRPLTDLFKLQDDIANSIVAALMPHLVGAAKPQLRSDSGAITPELFERFLWARRRAYDRTAVALAEARKELQAITQAAPGYAPAWAWLARMYVATSAASGGDIPAKEAVSRAQQAIDTALRLDPNEASAYLAQASLWRTQDENDRSEQAVDKALALDPRLVDAHILKERLLAFTGRADQAIAELETARAIDPLHPEVLQGLAHLLNLMDRKREAVETLDRLYEINPVSARQMELHLYSDSREVARELYLSGLNYREKGGKITDEERLWYAWGSLTYGIYDSPALTGSIFEPTALALLGKTGQARAALGRAPASGAESVYAQFAESNAYIVLGDYERAANLLWSKWAALEEKRVGFQFDPGEAVALVSLLQKLGWKEQAEPVLASLETAVASWSPLHQADSLWFQGMVRVFRGDVDGAVAKFQRMAETGSVGDRSFGPTPLPLLWGVAGDPRLAPVIARLNANRDAQLAELKRLQASGMNATQARADYVATLGGASGGTAPAGAARVSPPPK